MPIYGAFPIKIQELKAILAVGNCPAYGWTIWHKDQILFYGTHVFFSNETRILTRNGAEFIVQCNT